MIIYFIELKGVSRHFANERERGRNQSVNGAFQVLRDLIPTENMDRKMSKIETLRLATKYILHLATYINSGIRIIYNVLIITFSNNKSISFTQKDIPRHPVYNNSPVSVINSPTPQAFTWHRGRFAFSAWPRSKNRHQKSSRLIFI